MRQDPLLTLLKVTQSRTSSLERGEKRRGRGQGGREEEGVHKDELLINDMYVYDMYKDRSRDNPTLR